MIQRTMVSVQVSQHLPPHSHPHRIPGSSGPTRRSWHVLGDTHRPSVRSVTPSQPLAQLLVTPYNSHFPFPRRETKAQWGEASCPRYTAWSGAARTPSQADPQACARTAGFRACGRRCAAHRMRGIQTASVRTWATVPGELKQGRRRSLCGWRLWQ